MGNPKTQIPLLIQHFLVHFNEEKNGQIDGVTEAAMDILVGYDWPGNIRELRNLMERIVVLKGEGTVLTDDLPSRMRHSDSRVIAPTIELSEDGICLNTAVTEFEKALILQSLEKANGVKNRAAKLLHLNRTTLVEKIKRHNLSSPAPCGFVAPVTFARPIPRVPISFSHPSVNTLTPATAD